MTIIIIIIIVVTTITITIPQKFCSFFLKRLRSVYKVDRIRNYS